MPATSALMVSYYILIHLCIIEQITVFEKFLMRNEFNTANGGENKSGVAGRQAANSFRISEEAF
jgi:hypothetical protein